MPLLSVFCSDDREFVGMTDCGGNSTLNAGKYCVHGGEHEAGSLSRLKFMKQPTYPRYYRASQVPAWIQNDRPEWVEMQEKNYYQALPLIDWGSYEEA